MTVDRDALSILLQALGIDPGYGIDPYRPAYPEAVELVDVEPNIIGRMQQLTAATAADWCAMKQAAHADGVQLLLVSGYRSIDYQAELLRRKLAQGMAIDAALTASAAPGFSQHHSGQTVDVATPGARPLTESFESTPAFHWLCANAARFRFRMPYGRANRFGFPYEPWHWTQLADPDP